MKSFRRRTSCWRKKKIKKQSFEVWNQSYFCLANNDPVNDDPVAGKCGRLPDGNCGWCFEERIKCTWPRKLFGTRYSNMTKWMHYEKWQISTCFRVAISRAFSFKMNLIEFQCLGRLFIFWDFWDVWVRTIREYQFNPIFKLCYCT